MRVAQRSAAWLVEKPLHGVLGLSLTLLLPMAPFLTGAAMAVLVFASGIARAGLLAIAAAALVTVLAAVTQANVAVIARDAAIYWVPAAAMALFLSRTRSITLTIQVTAVLALIAVLAWNVIVDDPVAFWATRIEEMATLFASIGYEQMAVALRDGSLELAPLMVVPMVLSAWSIAVLTLVLGYWWYRQLPAEQGTPFGRFCDVTLGRTIAAVVVGIAVLAAATQADWLVAAALAGLGLYWLQGIALVHWLRVEWGLPAGMLVLVYALVLVLSVLPLAVLAAAGFGDAWIDLRRRAGQKA